MSFTVLRLMTMPSLGTKVVPGPLGFSVRFCQSEVIPMPVRSTWSTVVSVTAMPENPVGTEVPAASKSMPPLGFG